MNAAARRGVVTVAAAFHSTAAAALPNHQTTLSSPNLNQIARPALASCRDYIPPRIRFDVREKRADAKSALKNILLNGGMSQEQSNKQTRQQKAGARPKVCPSLGNSPHSRGRRVPNRRNFDDDDDSSDSPYGSFGGKASFTWYWPGEDDDLSSTPSGFQWRDEPRSTKSKGRVWNESDVDEEDEPCRDDLKTHRISLGLPDSGPLKLDHIKSAFRASALKWHPDKHQGSSQPEAEEKFRRCIEAYSALAGASKSSK